MFFTGFQLKCNALHSRLQLSSVWPPIRVLVCHVGGYEENGLRTICHFFTVCRPQKKQSNNVFGDIVAHDRDLLLKVKDLNRDNFSTLNVVILQRMTDKANITTANI